MTSLWENCLEVCFNDQFSFTVHNENPIQRFPVKCHAL